MWLRALILSVVIHALVFLLFPVQSILLSPFAAAGPRSGDDRAADGSMQAMNMRTPPSRPIVPPPIPIPTAEIEPIEFEDEPSFEPPALAGESMGPEEEPGLQAGTGAGDGGTEAEGLDRARPVPRGIIYPPDLPDLDEPVGVWVFVDATGRVVPDSTALRPPSPDRDWNRQVIELSSEWVFDPATENGEPVAAWFFYSVEG